MNLKIELGNNIDLLKAYPDNYFDSVVTDCPYGLSKEPNALKLLQDWIDHGYHEIKGKGFMGKSWDSFVPQPLFWKEVFRVLKPGGYVLAFFGTRTYDWGTLAIRLAGFEIRDMITYHYGSGFPKSLDISKQLDKMAGAEREITRQGTKKIGGYGIDWDINSSHDRERRDNCVTDEAKQWDGWGTALKPATEPICVARKPLEKGLTVAENVLKYGTGGINLDGCAIGDDLIISNAKQKGESFTSVGNGAGYNGKDETYNQGRFPANVIFDPFMADELDKQSGELTSGKAIGIRAGKSKGIYGDYAGGQPVTGFGDTGGASRFFYCAKASQFERNAGCENLIKNKSGIANDKGRSFNGICLNTGERLQTCNCGNCKHDQNYQIQTSNFHPTVKPISLMSYLQRLVTPPGGKTLDPFAGSGTSGCSAYFENIGEIVLMEMDETYLPIIEARTKYWSIERNRINYLDEIRVKKDEPIENQMKLF